MNGITSCKFNMDTGCVEMLLGDGTMISINCIAVEDDKIIEKTFKQSIDEHISSLSASK